VNVNEPAAAIPVIIKRGRSKKTSERGKKAKTPVINTTISTPGQERLKKEEESDEENIATVVTQMSQEKCQSRYERNLNWSKQSKSSNL